MKNQGEETELRFMLLSYEKSFIVSKPFGDNAKYDVIVDDGKSLERIQIKSTSRKDTSSGADCYSCLVSHGRDSKQQYTKKDIDSVVIYVIPENAWYKIPIEEIKGKTVKLYPHRVPHRESYERYRI
jgi:hypothetical protein